MYRPQLPPGDIYGIHFSPGWVELTEIMRPGGLIKSMKNPSDPIGDETRDLFRLWRSASLRSAHDVNGAA